MELEFDKEMDAILRRARADTAVSTGTHPDADAIAAFIENAVPQGVRHLYVEHFADCGSCRKLLSQTILMNETAASEVAENVVAPVPAASAESWITSLFRTPGLALGMGALVVVFAAILGFLVVQDRNGAATSVSQVSDKAANMASGPFASSPNEETMSNTSAANSNIASAAPYATPASENTVASNSSANAGAVSGTIQPSGSGSVGSAANAPVGVPSAKAAESSSTDSTSSTVQPVSRPEVSVAPPPPLRSETAAPPYKDKVAEDKKTDDDAMDKRDDEIRLARKRALDDTGGNRAGFPNQAPKKAGPSRAGSDQQMQSKVMLDGVSATRTVGQKSFGRKNGVWYDLSYHGQSTRSIKRGSDKYKKLDVGLRSAVESLDGTVIIVWGSRAYKIY